jgi:hypothetical protein
MAIIYHAFKSLELWLPAEPCSATPLSFISIEYHVCFQKQSFSVTLQDISIRAVSKRLIFLFIINFMMHFLYKDAFPGGAWPQKIL